MVRDVGMSPVFALSVMLILCWSVIQWMVVLPTRNYILHPTMLGWEASATYVAGFIITPFVMVE